MSIFSWLFSKSRPGQGTTQPAAERAAAQTGVPSVASDPALATLKQQRQERREQLYSVVRDAMLRSAVLASHYKFKVLSLDTLGRQFLIMMDLVGDKCLRPDQLSDIEHLIGSTAAQRHQLLVTAVYWRQTEPVVPVEMVQAAVPVAAPAVVVAPVSAAAARHDVAAPTPRGRGGEKKPGFEPIGQDEVLAFKKAIQSQQPAPAEKASLAVGETRVSGLRNSAAMTGFEDTQLLEPDDVASPLSSTQFGDL